MEVLAIELKGKREDVQCIQFLVPLRDLSLSMNVCGVCGSLGVGYRDKELPLEKRIFLEGWDIMSSNN
jgi:hypothetical protein